MRKYISKVLLVLLLTLSVVVVPSFAEDVDENKEKKEITYPIIDEDTYGCYVQDKIGYFFLTGSIGGRFDSLMEACMIFDRLDVQRIRIILISGGGNVFEGMALAQLVEEQKSKGKIVEIRCYGITASAAVFILVAGSPGHRYIAPSTFVMVHELLTFKYLALESVSDQEKGAKISRMIQDTLMGFIADRSKLALEDLRIKCKEETWADAKTAIQWGFADKML